jgi:glycosyltransferase involved in cell wall biosynthesis
MTIVHVIAYYNNVWKYQENHLAEAQVQQGHEVHIVASDRNFPFPNYAKTAEPALGPRRKKKGTEIADGYTVHYLPLWLELSGRVWMRNLKNTLRKLKPDVLIFHGITQPATLFTGCNPGLRCKKVADEHVLLSDIADSAPKKILFALLGFFFKKRLVRHYGKVIAISEGTVDMLRACMKFRDNEMKLVPLGADTRTFFPDPEAGRVFRTKHGIADTAFVIGYTGKMAAYKMVHLLAEAAARLAGPDISLLLVGNVDPDYKPTLEESLGKSGVKNVWLPALPASDLPAVYNACDVLAWPAHQTISTLDASACGKPVICSDFLKERYNSGQGFGIPSGNLEELVNALQKLYPHPSLRAAMGQAGRHWAENEVSWEAISRKMLT